MITLFQRYILILALLCVAVGGAAQKAAVERMEMLPMDLSGSKYPRLDNNGEPCALVRVEVIADGVDFFGNVLKPVEHKMGEYWVYMLAGSKMLQIKSDVFLPLMVNFADYGVTPLQPKATYVITLSLPAASPNSSADDVNYLVMSVSPDNARVTVDGKEREVRNGIAKVMLPKGTYTYHVEAPGFLPEDGRVTVIGQRTEKYVALLSAKGTLAVSTSTPGTEIYINGERMGTGSWRGELFPDIYLVEGRLDSYHDVAQKVTLITGETATVTLPALTPITGSLNIDYEPVGASISVDGKAYGVTPAVVGKLPVGTHTVTIAAAGYAPATLTATVTDSQITSISGSLAAKPDNAVIEEIIYKPFKDSFGKWGFKDDTGKIIIPPEYDDVESYREGLAKIEINGKYGFIDKNNNMVIPAKYDNVRPFIDGLASVCKNGKWGFIDKTGKIIIHPKFNKLSWSFSEGLACAKVKEKWGFIDKDGKFVIPAKYDDAHYFSEGLAAVEIKKKWGFIDKNGNMAIPAIYDGVWWFSDGKAEVELSGRKFYIDKNGNEIK